MMAVNCKRTDEETSEFNFIDVEELDFSDDQTWLSLQLAEDVDFLDDQVDTGEYFSTIPSYLKCRHDNGNYRKVQLELLVCLGSLAMHDTNAVQCDKQKFDSRTYTRPKRRSIRPSLQAMVENGSRTITKQPASKASTIVRHKTFTLDVDGVKNHVLKDYAARRVDSNNLNKESQLFDNRNTSQQLEENALSENILSKPIDIKLSEPVHNLHNTFNRHQGAGNPERSFSMGQCDDSFMNVSPPSMVSSIAMDASGNYNSGSFLSRKGSISSQKDLLLRVSDVGQGTNALMESSMTNSIMDEKEMNTSFLSQTPGLDSESLLSSLPLSLASSFNSTIASAQFIQMSKLKDNNLVSSGTFTRLVETEDDSSNRRIKHSLGRLNSNEDYQNVSSKSPRRIIMDHSYIVEKENMNDTFVKDDNSFLMGDDMDESFLKEIAGRPSLNLTMDKQELNEIINARQKLSLARSSLPSQKDGHISISPRNAPLRKLNELHDISPQVNRLGSPVRNGTYRKLTPPSKKGKGTIDNDLQVEDIAYTTISVVDKRADSVEKLDMSSSSGSNKTSNKDHCEQTMVCSSDSLEGGATGSTISGSGSPPEIVPDDNRLGVQQGLKYHEVTSTPQQPKAKSTLFQSHALSPIVDPGLEDSQMASDYTHSTTIIRKSNSSSLGQLNQEFPEEAHVVKRQSTLRYPDKRQSMYAGSVKDSKISEIKSPNLPVAPCPPVRKSGLPTSKLRQYSSHKELSKIPGSNLRYPSSNLALRGLSGLRDSARTGVYASNPALSPTAPSQHALMSDGGSMIRKGSYTIMGDSSSSEKEVDHISSPPAKSDTRTMPLNSRLVRQVPPSDNKRLLNRPREEYVYWTESHKQNDKADILSNYDFRLSKS